MGQGLSTDTHLSVRDIYRYCAKGFTVAEVEFAFRRYRAIKAPILSEDYQPNVPPLNLVSPTKNGAPPAADHKSSKTKHPPARKGTIYIDPRTETPLFPEQLKLDWLLNRVYYTLFPTGKEITFDEYLSKLSEWKLYTLEDRIKFLFKVLDYDQDGVLTPPDISIFISQLTHHKYALSDRVRVRADGRLGTVRHIGETKFAAGVWVGIELDQPVGKHNGTVQGVKYFTCENLRGLFVPYANVELVEHVKMAEEICEQLSGFVGVGGGIGGGGSDALGYEKFRDALVADSCYRSELDAVRVGL